MLPSAHQYEQPPPGHSNEHVALGPHDPPDATAPSPYGSSGACVEAQATAGRLQGGGKRAAVLDAALLGRVLREGKTVAE